LSFLVGILMGALGGAIGVLILDVRDDAERKREIYTPWK